MPTVQDLANYMAYLHPEGSVLVPRHYGEIEGLAHFLHPDETILAYHPAIYPSQHLTGLLVTTPKRILFVWRVQSSTTYLDFPLHTIHSLEYHPELGEALHLHIEGTPTIEFVVAGGYDFIQTSWQTLNQFQSPLLSGNPQTPYQLFQPRPFPSEDPSRVSADDGIEIVRQRDYSGVKTFGKWMVKGLGVLLVLGVIAIGLLAIPWS